jgi:phosphatidylserine decarboxylase
MSIHREGYPLLSGLGLILTLLNLLLGPFLSPGSRRALFGASALSFAFVLSFFRYPRRYTPQHPGLVVSPADGTVVALETRDDPEYGGPCQIVSIFLSVFNVHANWVPVAGQVCYSRYHPGQYLVAFHPKSSELNERSTVMIQTEAGPAVLVRQIAGLLARRILTYPQLGEKVAAGDELGFIKFGSRVDVLLPLDSQVAVQLYQQVRGGESPLAYLNSGGPDGH